MPEQNTPSDFECISTIVAAAIGELNSELTVVLSAVSSYLDEVDTTEAPSQLLQDALAAAQRAKMDVARLMAFVQWAGASPLGNLSEIATLLKSEPC